MPRESSKTEDRVLVRECEWCGAPFAPKPRARHQRYCARSCRQRAYEVRTARERQDRDADDGAARGTETPVREIVERHTVRTVVRTVQSPVQMVARPVPTRGREVQEELEAVAELVQTRQIGHWDHGRVWRGVEALLIALDHTHPGGIEALRTRR